MATIGYWVDRPSSAFRELDGARTIAVLPLGASEQHGPHLPLSTDRDQLDEVLRRTLRLIDPAGPLSVLALPTLAACKSNEHLDFPGTLALSAETILRVIMELAGCVARAGVRRLALVNGHGGNTALMEIALRDIRARYGLLTAGCSWYQLCRAEELLSPRELAHGIHAGEMETSAMLAIRPELVDMAQARDFRSATEDWAERFQTIGLGARPGRPGWLMGDLSPEGACGDASAGTAAKGELLLDRAAEGVALFLREFGELTMPERRPEGA